MQGYGTRAGGASHHGRCLELHRAHNTCKPGLCTPSIAAAGQPVPIHPRLWLAEGGGGLLGAPSAPLFPPPAALDVISLCAAFCAAHCTASALHTALCTALRTALQQLRRRRRSSQQGGGPPHPTCCFVLKCSSSMPHHRTCHAHITGHAMRTYALDKRI
mmetsp:Transcript_4020/g.8697  ORF Transcript_4020/g.8697 Transcript_4020/m.8697 type:complete len:160 (-) Transcript_4020:491-970(-)